MGYNWFYYLKKTWALYPGVIRPVSADALTAHYARRREARGVARASLDACIGLLFHAWIPWRAWSLQQRLGHDAAWRRRVASLAHAGFADPQDVALFRIGHADEFRTCMRRFESAALNKVINPRGWQKGCALADKRLFAERCRTAGLPHPAMIAVREQGVTRVLEEPAGRELIVKPAFGEGGGGVHMLGCAARSTDIDARLSQLRLARGPLIVQPRVAVHPALRGLALSALPTIRILTMKDEQGRPEVVGATLRFASNAEACVDNMKAGGLMSAVDLGSGRLGVACRGYGGPDHCRHPVNGEPVEGRLLPDWEAAKLLAMRAHADGFADYALVGWDVAPSPEGPVLIEGNGKPSVLLSQRAAHSGLAQGRYGKLLAHHLAKQSPY